MSMIEIVLTVGGSMKKEKVIVSLIMNILIFILVVLASIIMFTGFRFMEGPVAVLTASKLAMFRFFTVDSNIFMGIVSFIFIIKDIELLSGKIKEISKKYYILKLMSTTAVGLTFFVVFTYLIPISGSIMLMLLNSNLFFHLVVPVLSILTFILFEGTDLKFKDSLYGIIPTVIYAVYYVTNILVHVENGKVAPIYDWYWFVQGGLWMAFIVVPLILLVSWIISLFLYKLNKVVRSNI